ncbi:UNVERIFIED_CONTAM: hypothetical protein RMT77_007638 [Armadillidium vulgare]
MKRTQTSKENSSLAKCSKIDSCKFFTGFCMFILPARFGPQRLKLFQRQVTNKGGKLFTDSESPLKVTHIILEETINKETLMQICKVKQFSNSVFIKCTWLTDCIKTKGLVLIKDYIVYEHSLGDNKTIESEANSPKKTSLNNDTEELISESKSIATESYLGKFACAHSSDSFSTNQNEHITSELEKLSSAYESRKDTWRAVGYQKAISAIKNYPKVIETWEEAKSIRGVGERLADKIKEILESGQLRKVKEVCDNEETKVLQLFIGVWGAGPTTANNWYCQGFRTLEDLKTKANLTKHQQIGLKYYDELNERMLRPEVEEIEAEVVRAAETVKKGLKIIVCGSYRRGKTTCGDVDILITHPDGISHQNIFKALLEKLKENEFLTDDLVIQENNGNQQKYLGVCKLPGNNRKHRRLDIIVVPYDEFAPAIMYFTGSAHFNRSMRLLATKLGMSLSEHGLRARIIRDGKNAVTGGICLETPSEESIFEHLGLNYRPPNERNH